MKDTSPGDPRFIHLQWFAGEGNPGAGDTGGSTDPGQGGGSFLTGSNGQDPKQGASSAGSGGDASSASDPGQGRSEGGGNDSSSRSGSPEGSGAQRPKWKDQVSKDLQEEGRLDRFAKIDDLGKAYLELEGKLGAMVSLPGEKASADEWNALFAKLGRPGAPADYQLEKMKDLPPGIDYAPDDGYRAKAHELGLSQKQASEMYAFLNADLIANLKTAEEKRKTATKDTESVLRKEWGRDYDLNYQTANRALSKYAKGAAFEKLSRFGLLSDPDIARMFSTIGKDTGEGAADRGAGPAANAGREGSFDYSDPK